MALRTITRTGTTTNFSGPFNGQDLLTATSVTTTNTQVSGALNSAGGALYTARPIAITYAEITVSPTGATIASSGSVIVEISSNTLGTLGTAPTVGANGTNTFDLTSTTLASDNFFAPWVTGANIFYGLYGAGSTTINYRRGAYTDSDIIRDGVLQFGGAAMVSKIEWVSVPSAPLNLASTVSGTSVTLTWDYPSDDGYTTSGSGAQISGNRILYRSTSNQTIQSTGDIGDVLSYTFTGLTSNDTYEFWVAAINGVCDIHNGADGQTPGATYDGRNATTGSNAFVTAIPTGGIIRVFSGSTPVAGLAHVNQNGTWVPALSVYGNSGGTWLPSQ